MDKISHVGPGSAGKTERLVAAPHCAWPAKIPIPSLSCCGMPGMFGTGASGWICPGPVPFMYIHMLAGCSGRSSAQWPKLRGAFGGQLAGAGVPDGGNGPVCHVTASPALLDKFASVVTS